MIVLHQVYFEVLINYISVSLKLSLVLTIHYKAENNIFNCSDILSLSTDPPSSAPQIHNPHPLLLGNTVPLAPVLVGVQAYILASLVLGLVYTLFVFVIPFVYEAPYYEHQHDNSGEEQKDYDHHSSYSSYERSLNIRTNSITDIVLSRLVTTQRDTKEHEETQRKTERHRETRRDAERHRGMQRDT